MSRSRRVNIHLPPELGGAVARIAKANGIAEADILRIAALHWLAAGAPLFLPDESTNCVISAHNMSES